MMAISTIRKFTDEDQKVLDKKAADFINRHKKNHPQLFRHIDEFTYKELVFTLEEAAQPTNYNTFEYDSAVYLNRLWLKIFQRATRTNGDTVAYGYIGYSVD